MNTTDLNILNTFADRVRRRFPSAQVLAFGSRARGTSSEDSDFDVCVVLPSQEASAREFIREVAWEVGFETDTVITTVKYTFDEFNSGAVSFSPLVRAIRQEGIAA